MLYFLQISSGPKSSLMIKILEKLMMVENIISENFISKDLICQLNGKIDYFVNCKKNNTYPVETNSLLACFN